MTTDTSSSGGVTPAAGSPVTGTPASDGVTPQTPTLTLEEALKKISDLEHAHKNAKETADRHAKAVAKYEQAQRDAELATKSDLEKAQARAEAFEKQLERQTKELINSRVREVALQKGIIDPEAAALMLREKNALEYGDDGLPTNLEKALDELIKSKPYLKPEGAAPASAAQTAPAIPVNNHGRSNYAQQQGTLAAGKVTFQDIYNKQ